MSCPCCLQTPCVSLCRMPNEIIIELTLGALTFTRFPITPADIATIEASINGTYSLSYSTYFSSKARYTANYGSPYLPSFTPADFIFDWNCTSVSGFSSLLDIQVCRASAGADRYLFSSPTTGMPISDATLPTITSYCGGTSFVGSFTGELRAAPDTVCGVQPGAFQQISIFDLDVDFSI